MFSSVNRWIFPLNSSIEMEYFLQNELVYPFKSSKDATIAGASAILILLSKFSNDCRLTASGSPKYTRNSF